MCVHTIGINYTVTPEGWKGPSVHRHRGAITAPHPHPHSHRTSGAPPAPDTEGRGEREEREREVRRGEEARSARGLLRAGSGLSFEEGEGGARSGE